MGVGYEKAPREVVEAVDAVIEEYHPDLKDAGVTIQVLFAHLYNKDGDAEPAMRTRGQMVLAKIAITNLQDRTRGIPDAKLIIDREYGWQRLSESRRAALIDHELTHLNLTLDSDGVVKTDDRGRPKLHTRHHDWELTGFEEVVERHGEAALEISQMAHWQEQYPRVVTMIFGSKKVEVEVGAHPAK